MPPRYDLSYLNEDFFHAFGIGPVVKIYDEWKKAEKKHKALRARYVHCLALCNDDTTSVSQVEKWIRSQKNPAERVDAQTAEVFRRATEALGDPARVLVKGARVAGYAKKHGPTHVAVFLPLAVASEAYHLEIIRGIVRSADRENVLPSFHELPGDPDPSEARSEYVRQVVTRFAPAGLIFVRITPDRSLISALTIGEHPLPTVLIHADRLKYPAPVIANVVPDHREVGRALTHHLFSRPHIRGRIPQFAMVSMPEEPEGGAFPCIDGNSRSIRNDRMRSIQTSFAGWQLTAITVPDYGFRHALDVLKKHPDTDAYICLSDGLAVGLKHLLVARDPGVNACERIVGFDGSALARNEGVPSFSQHLESVGEKSMARLCQFLAHRLKDTPFTLPPEASRQIMIPVTLEIPG